MIELLIEAERALSVGMVDRADQLYRQVADADPHSSIAVVGLARVALERRDDLGAYLLARRALRIDPENDAARRLATRLEEVLATRGAPVDDPLPILGPPPEPASAVAPTAAGSGPPQAPLAAPAPAPTTSRRRRSLLDRLRGR